MTDTLKIKASDPSQGEFVIINACDFDATQHELFDAPAAPAGSLSTTALALIEKEGLNPQDFIDAGITTVAAVKAQIVALKGTPVAPPAPAAVNMDELRFEPEALALAKDAGVEDLSVITASSETGVVTVADVETHLDAQTGE